MTCLPRSLIVNIELWARMLVFDVCFMSVTVVSSFLVLDSVSAAVKAYRQNSLKYAAAFKKTSYPSLPMPPGKVNAFSRVQWVSKTKSWKLVKTPRCRRWLCTGYFLAKNQHFFFDCWFGFQPNRHLFFDCWFQVSTSFLTVDLVFDQISKFF